jgi:autotransporter-associated beta strand protein
MVLALLANVSQAATIYWDGASAGWDSAANWSTAPDATTPNPDAVPGAGDIAFFSITNDTDGATVSLNGNQSVLGLGYRAGGGNIVIQGNTSVSTDRTLTIGEGGINNVTAASGQTIGSTTAGQKVNVRLNGSQLWKSGTTGGAKLYIRNTVSRDAADTASRTLLLDIGTTYPQQIAMQDTISDGGASGTLGLWKIGPGQLTLNGANTFSGGMTISAGSVSATQGVLSAAPLVLRGSSARAGYGVILSGALSTFNHSDIRLENGVNTLNLDATSTFNMGTIARSGGVLRIAALSGQTYNVGNTNVNGILGPWAVTTGGLYVRNDGTGKLETLTAPAATTETSWTDATANYTVGADQTLTADRFANTIQGGFGRAINLGSSSDNDLTVNGLMALNGSWNISRSGTSTGKLIIGDKKELVVAGSANFTASAPIVDNAAGASMLTLALWGTSPIVTLSGTNTYSGGTVYSMGSTTPKLNINSAYALGTGAFYMNGASSAQDLPVAQIDNSSAADITLANNNAQFWNTDFTYLGTRSLNMGTGTVSLGSYPGATRTVTVTANTLTIGGVISDGSHAHLPTRALTKAGAGTLELTGASTYSGATTVSAGTLKLGASASLASSNITVAAGATLQLAGSSSLPNSATLYLNGTNSLASGVLERIAVLYTNGILAASGSYGSTESGADFQNDTLFSGSGKLLAGQSRNRGTLFLIR